MAVMSTGSAEVIAVSSIIIYDIYQTHIAPFRSDIQVASFLTMCSAGFVRV
jgi:Na+/proline symporter